MTFADRQVDRPGRAGHERDRGWLVALAGDSQDPVAALDRLVLDVGLTSFADAQPVTEGEARVQLTESFELLRPPGPVGRLVTPFALGVRDRRADLEDAVRATLAAIKREAEAAH